MKRGTWLAVGLVVAGSARAAAAAGPGADDPIRPVPFTAVHIQDGFWSPRLETNRSVTVRHDFEKCETTGRVANFAMADVGALTGDEGHVRADLLGGVTVVAGRALALRASEDGRSVLTREQDFLAVPYHAWAHRGDGEMAVWLPRRVRLDFAVP